MDEKESKMMKNRLFLIFPLWREEEAKLLKTKRQRREGGGTGFTATTLFYPFSS